MNTFRKLSPIFLAALFFPVVIVNTVACDEGDGDGDDVAACAMTCDAADDCGVPENWECNGGFCDPLPVDPEPCTTENCPDPLMCDAIDGVDTCIFVCETDDDCMPDITGATCSLETDGGNMTCYIEPEPFSCEPGEDCAGLGICNAAGDGCECSSDDDCTAAGTACRM